MKWINSDKYLDVTKNVSSIAQDKSQSDCKKWIPHICCCIQRQTWSFLQWSWVSQKKFAVNKVAFKTQNWPQNIKGIEKKHFLLFNKNDRHRL